MKKVVVFQQVPHETLGTIGEALDRVGLEWEVIEFFSRGTVDFDVHQATALVILGGPMNVDEIDTYPFLQMEVEWIQQALAHDLPILGVCLGAQLLAKALGASVYPNESREIGWYDIDLTPAAGEDKLLRGVAARQTVFQWHGDTFDLPSGAVQLATSELCNNQAFRYGSRAYGLQFHMEVTAEMIERWLSESTNQAEIDDLGYIDPQAIRDRISRHVPRMWEFGNHFLAGFADECRAMAQ